MISVQRYQTFHFLIEALDNELIVFMEKCHLYDQINHATEMHPPLSSKGIHYQLCALICVVTSTLFH